MTRADLDNAVYEKLIFAPELLLMKKSDQSMNPVYAIDWLNEIVENANLDRVSDIYIFEEGFGNLDKARKEMLSHVINSVIVSNYGDNNLKYIESIIVSGNTLKNEAALGFLLMIGVYHRKFRDRIFIFIENNVASFTKNKLSIAVFYFYTVYEKELWVEELLKSVIGVYNLKYKMHESDVKYKGVTIDVSGNKKFKPKWKFW